MPALPSRTPTPDRALAEAHRVLEEVFGYKSFRLHQAAIIAALLEARDVLALMPTGGGKSLCYQVPALVRAGTGIVVSPLIALMQDQVDALKAAGVRAAFLNSSQSWPEQQAVESAFGTGGLDLLYVAPERLLQDRTLALLERAPLALFAIDEAHCVSQWGHDFRPEYRQLKVLATRFPDVPRIALTATADERTREEIVSELALGDAERFVASFDRPNIRYTIAEMGGTIARERLWQFLSTEHAEDAGIVYCLSRKAVEETAAWLTQKGRRALAYHAGLAPEVRRAAQSRFVSDDGIIIVATIAFGMGIDKPDVRFVAHLNLPKSIESYYQETGRAGRDGEPADAWMAYGLQDMIQLRQWIGQSEGSEAFKQVQRQKLDALIGLAEMAGCRRQALLAYFGERLGEPCGNCDNCITPPETVDGTREAQMALSAVYRTGQRFGVGYVIDILQGKADERALRNGHDRLSVFGIGKDVDGATWRALFRQLAAAGFLAGDEEGHGTLRLAERARPLLRHRAVSMPRQPPRQGRRRAGNRYGLHCRRRRGAVRGVEGFAAAAFGRGEAAALRHRPGPYTGRACQQAAGERGRAARHHRARREQDQALRRRVPGDDRVVQEASGAREPAVGDRQPDARAQSARARPGESARSRPRSWGPCWATRRGDRGLIGRAVPPSTRANRQIQPRSSGSAPGDAQTRAPRSRAGTYGILKCLLAELA
jgi:ATP-dependent DNA helicase RecQ